MRLSVLISVLILAICAGLATFVLVRQAPPKAAQPTTVVDLLRAYKCRTAETKKVIIRGIEDNYSPTGTEPNFLQPGRQSNQSNTIYNGGSYDQLQFNRFFTDSIQIPKNISRGVFVIRFKKIEESLGDTISIGDIRQSASTNLPMVRFSGPIETIEEAVGWAKFKDIYFADFDTMQLFKPINSDEPIFAGSLLDFVRAGGANGWVDVSVQDDTAVDVMGAAICIEPPGGKGFTLALSKAQALPYKGLVSISCAHGDRDQYRCNYYLGDTSCETILPVACFRPLAAPLPTALKRNQAAGLWSGGQLAFTDPVQGGKFRTISESDSYCADRFGSGWRTAEIHDGMHNMGIAAFGSGRGLSTRAWVDINDQPYATCWAR